MSDILGIIGSILGAILAAPQALRAYRVGVEGVSALTYQLMSGGLWFWIVYDGNKGYWSAFPGMICMMACALLILALIYKKNRSLLAVLPIALVSFLFAIGLHIADLISVSGWIAVIITTIISLPQLRDVFVKKNIDGVSVGTWIVGFFEGSVWIAFGVLNTDAQIIVANVFFAANAAAIVVETERRRKLQTDNSDNAETKVAH